MMGFYPRMLAVFCLGVAIGACLTTSSSAINLVLDYTYDTNNFFGSGNPDGAAAGAQAKAALQAAADYYSEILADTFSPIETPDPFSSANYGGIATWTWSVEFNHPATGAEIMLHDPYVAADEYRIYAGARDIGGSTLGIGGPGGWGWSSGGNGGLFSQSEINQINRITADFKAAVEDREETSGFANWGGAITFDRDFRTNWHYDHLTLPSGNEEDFFSVAIHELGHALGLGASDAWNSWISGGYFTGPQAEAEHGGQILLDCSPGCGHWAENTQSVVFGSSIPQEAALDPNITDGQRKLFTALDAAALKDIGWTVETPIVYASADYDTDGDVDAADLTILRNWFGIAPNGDADGDGDTDGHDLLTWQQQYTGSLPLLANVPEPMSATLLLMGLALAGRRR